MINRTEIREALIQAVADLGLNYPVKYPNKFINPDGTAVGSVTPTTTPLWAKVSILYADDFKIGLTTLTRPQGILQIDIHTVRETGDVDVTAEANTILDGFPNDSTPLVVNGTRVFIDNKSMGPIFDNIGGYYQQVVQLQWYALESR